MSRGDFWNLTCWGVVHMRLHKFAFKEPHMLTALGHRLWEMCALTIVVGSKIPPPVQTLGADVTNRGCLKIGKSTETHDQWSNYPQDATTWDSSPLFVETHFGLLRTTAAISASCHWTSTNMAMAMAMARMATAAIHKSMSILSSTCDGFRSGRERRSDGHWF